MPTPTPARPQPPGPPPRIERRGAERYELLAQVELRRHGEIFVLPVVNISASGMLVRVDDDSLPDLEVQEQVSIYVELLDLPDPIAVTLDAVVVRVAMEGTRPTGVAVMWKPLPRDARAQLVKLLEHAIRR